MGARGARYLLIIVSLCSLMSFLSSQRPSDGFGLFNEVTNTVVFNNTIITPHNALTREKGLSCYSVGQQNNVGMWLFPNGTAVSLMYRDAVFIVHRIDRVELLVDQFTSELEGVYTCRIPTGTNTIQTLCVGIYTMSSYQSSVGPLLNLPLTLQLVSPLTEYPPTFSLNCTTTMYPPTEVSWSFNQSPLTISNLNQMYSASQEVRDALSTTYDNVLTIRGGQGGSYRCNVSNSRGSVFGEILVKSPSSPPSNVRAMAIGNNAVEVTWTAVNNATSYTILYESDSSSEVAMSTQTNVTIEHLVAGTEYTIIVQGFSDIPGPISSATIITLNAPDPPSNVMANTLSANSIMVLWQMAPSSAGVNGVEITYTPVPGSCDEVQTGRLVIEDGLTTHHTLSGLQEYTEYNIAVRFRGPEGFGQSYSVERKTDATTPSGPPQMISVIPRSDTERRIGISWSDPNCIDLNGARVTGYKVRYGLSSEPSSQYAVVDTAANSRMYTVSGSLKVFLEYIVQVAVVNSEGVGPYSEPMRVVIVGAPGPVSEFVVNGDIVSAQLEWEPPVEGEGHRHITDYEIRYRQQSSNNYLRSIMVDNEEVTYRVTGLLPGNSYVFEIKPYIETLSGEPRQETVTTNIIDQIQGVAVTVLNETAVNVTWMQLNSNDVSKYIVFYSLSGTTSRKRQAMGEVTFPADSNWGVVRELLSGVEYQFQVVAVVEVSGVEREGERSQTSDDSTVILGSNGQGNLSSAIAGAVIAVLVIILLVVIVIMILYLVWRHNRSGKLNLAVRSNTLELKPRPAPLPLPDFDDTPQILSSKPVIQEYPKDTICLEGEKVVLFPKVVGTPPPTIAWYHEGCMVTSDYAIELSDDGKLTFVCVELKHAGIYRFTVSNNAGSVQGQVSLYVHSENEANSNGSLSVPSVESQKIHVSDFGSYVEEQHANSNRGFRDQYYCLSSGEEGHQVKWALLPENKTLNRFTNIVVYDDNRIKLKPVGGRADCQRDYINASYINGYLLPKKFIASQGPKEKTRTDFWRMIWQLRCPTIVMITNLMEGTRPKCAQYWPDYGSTEYGPFRVALTDEIVYADYTIRTFLVTLTIKTQTPLKVMQYHFTTWPDHGVPEYATSMLSFHRKVFAEHKASKGPMVVHCSAGVGRTGTFISIDSALQQAEIEDHVDIPAIITKLRNQRMKMVQTVDQYVFVHDAVLESLICGTTEIQSQYFKSAVEELFEVDIRTGKSGFQSQFEVLQQVTPKVEESLCPTALRHTNKNRISTHLPTDRWRVVLKAEYPDYICASFVNGYKKKKSFIVTQGPMQNTCRDFWKMVYERNCPAIVMLSDLVENSQETCIKYWPSGGIEQYREFAVSMLEEAVHDGFIERIFTITDSKSGQANKVSQFQVFNWNREGNIINLSAAINVINLVTSLQRDSEEGPLVVHCSDTVTRCGIFCAVANCIECCKTENSMDVFQAVKALRVQKPGAIPALQHYQMIHRMLLQYLKESSPSKY